MLIRLLNQDVSNEEILALLPGLELKKLPLMNNAVAQDDKNNSADAGTLGVILKMLSQCAFSMHFRHLLQDVALPMLSIFISGTHVIAAAYLRTGIRFSEVMSPGDVSALLYECFAEMPMADLENDQVYSLGKDLHPRDIIDDASILDTHLLDGEIREALAKAIMENPGIECILDDGMGEMMEWYAIRDGKRVLSLMEDNSGEVYLIAGSMYPFLKTIGQAVLERWQQMLKIAGE